MFTALRRITTLLVMVLDYALTGKVRLVLSCFFFFFFFLLVSVGLFLSTYPHSVFSLSPFRVQKTPTPQAISVVVMVFGSFFFLLLLFFLFSQPSSFPSPPFFVLFLLLLSSGAVVAGLTDLKFDPLGYVLLLINCVSTACTLSLSLAFAFLCPRISFSFLPFVLF
jgi:hypothetical protein